MKLSLFNLSWVAAANEDVQAANDSVSAGVFSVLDGGALFVPFGSYPQSVLLHPDDARKARALGHKVGTNGSAVATQLVDAQAANDMAADLTGLIARAMRGFKHIAVYNGHPYHPDAEKAKAYSDRRAYGWVKEISAANDGVRLDVDYTTLGTQAVNEGWFAFHSPQWDMRIVRIDADGIFCRPYRLRSGGLTNEPNIPVPPIVAANETGSETENREPRTENPNPMNPTLKAKLLKLLGLADDTNDEAFDQAANDFCDKALAEKDKPAPEPEKKDPPAEEKKDPPVEEKKKEEDPPAAAAANERGVFADFTLDRCISAGLITLAQRPAHRQAIIAAANEAELTAALAALNPKPAAKTAKPLMSAGLAAAKGDVVAANDAVTRNRLREEAVNDVLAQICKDRSPSRADKQKAWSIAQQRDQALFAN